MDRAIEDFLHYIALERRLSANTVDAYRRDLMQWEEYATEHGKYPLEPQTTAVNDLRLWVASCASSGICQRSIRRKVQALRAFYTFMMKRKGMLSNPASELALARVPRQLPVYARTDEVNRMIDSFDLSSHDFEEVRNRLILDLLYSTGIRCSELAGLLDCNVDTVKGELKVNGKRNKDRIVPFGTELAQSVERYRTLRKEMLAECRIPQLLATRKGEPMTREGIYKIVNKAMKMANVHAARRSPHVLRHSFATDMLNNGADISAVRQLLGHESLQTTQIYTHVTFRDLLANYRNAHPRGSNNPKK